MHNHRLKFLDLRQIRLPVPGLVSILHRVSGLLLFLALPFMLWTLQWSLRSIETYTRVVDVLHHPLSKLLLLAVMWAFLHHFCAGLRFLAIDLGLGVTLGRARATSVGVLVLSLASTAVLGVWLW